MSKTHVNRIPQIKEKIHFNEYYKQLYPEATYIHKGRTILTSSPLRPNDTDPSFAVYHDHGYDYGQPRRIDIIDLHQFHYRCSKREAIEELALMAEVCDE
jgi:hypothetical protein